VLNPVWSWLFHGERPSPRALLGGVLILGATMFKALIDARGPGRVAEA
jgi:drug/metabolite transporter (DMT)-like permease